MEFLEGIRCNVLFKNHLCFKTSVEILDSTDGIKTVSNTNTNVLQCFDIHLSQVQFEKDARTRYLQLLGYDQTDLTKRVTEVTGSSALSDKAGVNADELADKMSMLNAVSSEVKNKFCFIGLSM